MKRHNLFCKNIRAFIKQAPSKFKGNYWKSLAKKEQDIRDRIFEMRKMESDLLILLYNIEKNRL